MLILQNGGGFSWGYIAISLWAYAPVVGFRVWIKVGLVVPCGLRRRETS